MEPIAILRELVKNAYVHKKQDPKEITISIFKAAQKLGVDIRAGVFVDEELKKYTQPVDMVKEVPVQEPLGTRYTPSETSVKPTQDEPTVAKKHILEKKPTKSRQEAEVVKCMILKYMELNSNTYFRASITASATFGH